MSTTTTASQIMLGLLGTGIVAIALMSDQLEMVGYEPGSVGQFILIGIGLLLVVLAAFGNHITGAVFVDAYGKTALIVFNTLLFLLVVELAIISAFNVIKIMSGAEFVPSNEALSFRGDEPWYDDYGEDIRELDRHGRYVPYALWGHTAMTGEAININDDGTRSVPGASCANDAYRVFAYGGSTMWGVGAPDWETIPAYLQQSLEVTLEDRPVCVVNFGQMSYVSTQGVILLMRSLQSGTVPDLVIFYDGINDVIAARQTGDPGAHRNMGVFTGIFNNSDESSSSHPLVRWLRGTYTFRFVDALVEESEEASTDETPASQPQDEPSLAEGVVDAYLANYQIVAGMADAFGFDYRFFWQPTAIEGNKPLTEEERMMTRIPPTDLRRLYDETYGLVREIAPEYENLYYIADVFDTVEDPVYIDYHHLTSQGNQIVAGRMIEVIAQ
jgi:lysophospholipase L1-like esterase